MTDLLYESSGNSLRGCLLGFGVIFGAMVICLGGLLVAIDVSCVNDAELFLVDYPGSALVEERYSMVRPFGLGETTRVLIAESPAREVRQWYNRHVSSVSRQGVTRGNRQAALFWRVDPTDEGGSRITLTSSCAGDVF